MSEYFLTRLKIERIPDIEDLVNEFGLKPSRSDGHPYAKQFDPNSWSNGFTTVRVYHEKYPIFIKTQYEGFDYDQDPGLPLVQRLVELLECEEVVNGVQRPYDMSLFKVVRARRDSNSRPTA